MSRGVDFWGCNWGTRMDNRREFGAALVRQFCFEKMDLMTIFDLNNKIIRQNMMEV